MSKKLFVGGLAWATTDAKLNAAFEPFGTIVEAKVIMERDTGRSRGFGFVTFTEESAANDACEALNGTELDGRTIRVNPADDAPKKSFGGPRRNFHNRNAEGDDRRDAAKNPDNNRRPFVEPSYGYAPADSGNRRDSRRKDRRKDRDRFDDDDRW